MPNWIIVTAVATIYLLFTLIVGLCARTNEIETQESYMAGSRSMGIVLLFFILGAESFSAFTFLGAPSWAYSRGAPAFYIMSYLTVGMGIAWVLGPRLRKVSQRLGHLTQADMLAGRFRSRWLSPLIAVISIAALVPYLTVQITGVGLLFQAATDDHIPFWLGALAAFFVVTLYVYVSGLRGIGWTTVVQGVMMIAIAWFLGLALAHKLYGGVGPMFHQIQASAPEYLTIPGAGKGMSWPAFSTAILVSTLGGYMWPHLFIRFYTANSVRTAKKVIVLSPLFAYLLVPILIIGFAGIMVYRGAPLDNADDVLLKLVIETASFSPWVIGIMLSGALAAAMSTGSNLAHTAAMVTARDLVGIIRPGMNDAQMVRLTRTIVVVISAAAYILALLNPSSLVTLLLGAYGVIAQLFPLTMAVLFWPRATRAGAYAGLCIGSAVYLLFTFGLASPFDFNPGVWGLIANGVALVGVSFATQPMESAHVRQFIAGTDATNGKNNKQTAVYGS